MTTRPATISGTIDEIRNALRDYIEAAYHIGSEEVVRDRGALLDQPGVIFQVPYIESTPRYQSGTPFSDLGLPTPAAELLHSMAHRDDGSALLHDPPYDHQGKALTVSLNDKRSLVVTTGTGSGKTESFLLPILGKLAIEAADRPKSFAVPSLRAIVLYPMNALVNDQLGRLRLMLGDSGVRAAFNRWSGRPARFARYTSRTLYPGVRTSTKDQAKLRPLGQFYVELLEKASGDPSEARDAAATLMDTLQARGKWPAKPDLERWYGKSGTRWQSSNGDFVRAVMLPEDPELLTRHEVLAAPPDVLVTNYSMLEYMLMRPLERPIFDLTRRWLAENPDERLLLVIDEAHLYRGAAGAEVGLLLRRLRARLGIPADRLQVICTSASFGDPTLANAFAAQLSGKREHDFETITGDLALRPSEGHGSEADARVLAALDLDGFAEADDDELKRALIEPFLRFRATSTTSSLPQTLFEALAQYPPMSLLVNLTMQAAQRLDSLGALIFPTAEKEVADRALTALISLGSAAKRDASEPSLLPCRVHSFFRGLPGLWACIDPACSAVRPGAPRPVGQLFAQPQDTCACGARVFELYTCRSCGAAYARAYTDDLTHPNYLWSEPGERFLTAGGLVTELLPLDLCLEDPIPELVEPFQLDLVTGRLNPWMPGDRTRQVFLKRDRSSGDAASAEDDDEGGPSIDGSGGEFRPCGVCKQFAGYGRSSVQDHQTKGDQPFQALVARQLQVQPASQAYSDFAPLRGRKVLTFSDSRQTAARLAPNLQTYSMQDVLRPLILAGMKDLRRVDAVKSSLSLEDLFLGVLIAARSLRVRLRPELRAGESLDAQREVNRVIRQGELSDPVVLLELVMGLRTEAPPQSLLRGIVRTITDRYYGLQSLALASLAEREGLRKQVLERVPTIGGVASDDAEKLALVRAWLNQWTVPGIWFADMPDGWWQAKDGVRSHTGKFEAIRRWLPTPASRREFERGWLPVLLEIFCEGVAGGKYRMRARHVTLETDGEWAYCQTCRTTQRPFPGVQRCINCARDRVKIVDPDSDPVFAARKAYYRGSSVRALREPPESPMAIIAAEHTAQLNTAQADEVFSKSEEHELLFQDVDLGPTIPGQSRTAIDVLSSTTTMEVGIDIGVLSGVALRNMPPARSNYQQRAGRAGRRGNAVATVIAFGSADSHDEHYFSEPEMMVRGPVSDPLLTLDNPEIARRHLTAFLLQRYHYERLPEIPPEDQRQLFEVLGTVPDFRGDTSALNRRDFEDWLRTNQSMLAAEADDWLPHELAGTDRSGLLAGIVDATLAAIDKAIDVGDASRDSGDADTSDGATGNAADDDAESVEVQSEPGEEKTDASRAARNLLDRLLYRGVLPRYAFPTDVVSFYVFNRNESTRFRPVFQYSPSQGLPVALTQYAPGKEVWVDGKLWTAGALYSPMRSELYDEWHDRRLYFECSICHFARTEPYSTAERGEVRVCPACGNAGTFGPARNWMRPPGFAHPVNVDEGTSPDDSPARSYATRAKLIAGEPSEDSSWSPLTARLREHYVRTDLLVTNTGPRQDGYSYCTRCGLIEPTAIPTGRTSAPHAKPYPDMREPECPGGASTQGLVLGTDFISDVLLVSIQVEQPLTLRPGYLATDVSLRTVSEALTIAATTMLEIEPGELQAEYRPALTQLGHEGLEAEIYLYDTLSGGAGFTRRARDLGRGLFEQALKLLETCPSNCDRSCYRCLRSFRNRFEHDLLDRHLGSTLLRYVLFDEAPQIDSGRAEAAADRLFTDLVRQEDHGVRFERDAALDIPGIGSFIAPILATSSIGSFIIALHGPLTPGTPIDPALVEAMEFGDSVAVVLVDQLIIERNLPEASRFVVRSVS
ncbi:MAG: DUF1998 domain-containing protein [Dehalococcoidia bacterium]|nr:MAG: DUF1998 domain-containing protein [Dehalococcoidia bacterium]